MNNDMTIEQKQGLGNTGTQIGVQNNYGLTVTEATQMAFAIFREYYPQLRDEALAELHKLVTEKLNNVPQDCIVPPKPRIAVPTLQNASITEEKDVRELYANLLTNSMNKAVKDGVHPGFVEIIKQLCPDEAKILRYMSAHSTVPTITVRYENEKGAGIDIVKNFSNIGECSGCEMPLDIGKYFNNLNRLGLAEGAPALSSLSEKSQYEPLKSHYYIQKFVSAAAKQTTEYKKVKISESYISLTDYGEAFCEVCLQTTNGITIEIWPMQEEKQ